MRRINISNESKRDAEVAFGTSFHRPKTIYKTSDGSDSSSERRLRATMDTTDSALFAAYGENLVDALTECDPEIDMELMGLKLEGLKRVYINPNQKVAYGVSLNEHVYMVDGTMREIRPDNTTAANIAVEGFPLRWTGKLIPKSKAMRTFMFKKSYQVQHINGLTFDFLYDMAKKLHESNSFMLVGAGAKGIEPLVMSNGGTPYRAFLEGRIDGDRYTLILRMTNLELKNISKS